MKSIVVPVAQNRTNECTITPKWFVQDSEYSVLPASFKLLINGEEAFGEVYDAIERATKSVCIICWGFQPSMYFKRGNKPGSRIGDLLEKKAREKDVQIRVLCWVVDPMGLHVDVVGLSGEPNTAGRTILGVHDRPATMGDDAYRYNREWFKRYDQGRVAADQTALDAEKRMGKPAPDPDLRFVGRGFGPVERLKIRFAKRADEKTSGGTKTYQSAFTSHHQKMVLVDFEDPNQAVGFVMGHNMLDEYWDTSSHSYRRCTDPRFGRNGSRPREDFSSRITGPMLGDLFHNFNTAWQEETGEDLCKNLGMPLFERYPLSGITRQKEKETLTKQLRDLEQAIDRERALQQAIQFDFSDTGRRQAAQSKAAQRRLEAEKAALQQQLAAPRQDAAAREETGTAIMGQILRTQPQYGVQDIKKCYLQAVNNAAQCIYIENQYFRWPVLAEKIKACADGQGAWGRRPELYGPIHLFVITNASEEGMGPGTENTGRMLGALGRANLLPGITREQHVEDTEAELKRARLTEAQARVRQSRAVTALGAARNSTDRKRADNELVAAQQQQKDAQAEQARLKQKLATQKGDKYVVAPEEQPNLKVHVCTLVAPDSPGRSGAFLEGKDEQGNARGLTREERLARANDALKHAENEAERLRLLCRQLETAQMYSPATPRELEDRQALDARLAAETKRRDEMRRQRQEADERCRQLRKDYDALLDGSNPIDWVDVYIHAKLMIIDDTFMTLGSTNINSRSMETDSELNIAHANPLVSQPARKKLWALHTKRTDGSGGSFSGHEPFTPEGMADAYFNWGKVMKRNKDRRLLKAAPIASLVEFYSGTTNRTNND